MPNRFNRAMGDQPIHQAMGPLNETEQLMRSFNAGGGDVVRQGFGYKKPKYTFWQVRIIYNNKITIKKGLFKKETLDVPFEFSANFINDTKEEAAAYSKYFLMELIEDKSIPKTVIKDGQVDESLVKIAVHKLEPAYMERDVSDK